MAEIFDLRFAIFDWSRATVVTLCVLALCGCSEKKPAQGSAPAAPADAIEKSVEKGPVRMTVRVWPREPRLSDLVELDITVEAANGVEVKPPVFGKAVGDFLVLDYPSQPPVNTDAKQILRFHYQLEPVHSGKHLVRSIAIEFRDKRESSETKGEPILLESEPLEVVVTSDLGDKTPNLGDLAPMHAPMPLPPSPIWRWLLAALGVCVAVAGGVIAYKRLRKAATEQEVKRTPEEIANTELRGLLVENLHGRGEFKEFYVRLTGIVRRYIEATTGVRAPEQTTEEFLLDVRERQVFPSDRAGQFGNFLEAADLVKYAAQQPGTRQVEESIARAQEFVGLPSALEAKK